jgi:choline kinase
MTFIVIAAAGKGERLNSSTPKPLYPIKGVPNIRRLLESISVTGLPVSIVLGYRSEEIGNYINDLNISSKIYIANNYKFAETSPMDSYKIGAKTFLGANNISETRCIIICADLVLTHKNLIDFFSIATKTDVAGVSRIRSKSGIGAELNAQGELIRLSSSISQGFEWGNFASVNSTLLLNSNHKLLSELISEKLPIKSFLCDCIDIDTQEDVKIAETLIQSNPLFDFQ